MTLSVPLDEYLCIARKYRGTSACSAIIGLHAEVFSLRKLLQEILETYKDQCAMEPDKELCIRVEAEIVSNQTE